MRFLLVSALIALSVFSCKTKDPNPTTAKLKVRFVFDDSQARLNNLGEPASLPAGHAGLTPDFQGLSAHFIELVSERIVPYKSGEAIFNGEEVSANNANPYGFTRAIDHDQAIVAASGEAFTEILIKDIKPGTYKHARISVAFQRYGITFNVNNIPVVGDLKNQKGTVASFVGYNTHINDLLVHEKVLAVNQAKLQGFWAFETQFDGAFAVYNQLSSGQAPANATTVVNPFPESPIPPGSCVVSGSMNNPLIITGEETEDVEIVFSFSINSSFEWVDSNSNGAWDIDAQQPANTEAVVDMGLRGLVVKVD